MYRPYILAVALHSSSGDTLLEIPTDVRKWLPGDIVVEENVPVPAGAADFNRIRVALLDPRTHKPAIRLGIAGRTEDGWYDLGSIENGGK